MGEVVSKILALLKVNNHTNRCVQDFGFAQGKQPYKQACPRCSRRMCGERMWWVDGGVVVDLAGKVHEGEVVVEGREVWVLS